MNAVIVYNVTSPSLVVYQPDSANGIAVIVCPGGRYQVLNIEREGTNIAKQLIKFGITVFLFKYRLVQTHTNHLYADGGHGLRTTHASTWINRFVEWLEKMGFFRTQAKR